MINKAQNCYESITDKRGYDQIARLIE